MKYLLLLTFGCLACAAQRPASGPEVGKQPVLIYKTRQDYRNLVPVLLSDDKTEIIAYPAPTDVYDQGKLALPTKLKRGYLLDNRGIGKNVAFLGLTYQQYAALPKAPPLAELYGLLLSKDPLLELYHGGNRADYQNLVAELNAVIGKGNLGRFRRLK